MFKYGRAKTTVERTGLGAISGVYIENPDTSGLGLVVHEPLQFSYQETLN